MDDETVHRTVLDDLPVLRAEFGLRMARYESPA